jgi:putative cardiolipin synthase
MVICFQANERTLQVCVSHFAAGNDVGRKTASTAMHTPRRQQVASSTIIIASLALVACSSLQPRPDMPTATAIPPGNTSAFDLVTQPWETRHPGQSAFRLVVEGTEAFVTRAHSARMAERSLDVQTYIWHDDLTGLYLANTLLDAADRGVKVRLLVDDMDARAKNVGFAALAAHQNIEVRLFNPFVSRSGTLKLVGEGLWNFDRLNRRMHNKTWIADNRIAIAGGRNIGNEYFGASDEVNFVDLDFAMVGPVVRDASASFDKYWNSPSAYPIEVLDPDAVSSADVAKLRAALTAAAREGEISRYAKALASDDAIKRLVAGDWPMQWATSYRFISDDPLKVTMQKYDAARTPVGAALGPMLGETKTATSIISPYFVPGKEATKHLAALAQSGKHVRILTNSLVANDVAAVHGGYSQYREPLLEGGVELWELKPLTGTKEKSSMFGSSGASLHTKALSVDSRLLFVGSYNLDQRSTWLNCEQGVMVESDVLAKQFEAIFATQTGGLRAWQVKRENNELSWSDGSESFDSDPKATLGRRFQAWLARVFNLEAQL